ncbi:MAG: nitroreductase family protein [Flavobacteriales bacterium]|nr:nitroreductase family protein [Flavobacteriales bacterium]
MSKEHPFIPYDPVRFDESELSRRAEEQYRFANRRRSIRDFSEKDIPFEVIQNIVMTAGTAPSGAHREPWTFCVIRSADLKKRIRAAAEAEEYESYSKRMSDQWLEDLKPMGTDWHKPFLEKVPWIIVVFKRAFEYDNGQKHQNYYVNESVGIACGMLINAIHNAGLATLTHTPSPMNFLTKILERPDNERPYLLLPVGYPAGNVKVPDLQRKSFSELAVVFD